MSSSKKMEKGQEVGGKRTRKETIIDDLPPEMLMSILKCLPTSSLIFSSRLVNRKWNESSSSLLRHRPETLLKFFLGSNGSFLFSDIPNKRKGNLDSTEEVAEQGEVGEYRTLKEFFDCYKTSKNFPFARFSFKNFYKGGDDLKTFLTQIGSKILSIKISPPENDVQLLRQLLTKHCPELQELIFDESQSTCEEEMKYSENLELFNEEDKIASLPNLKIFRLSWNYKDYLGVVEDILKAASSLKEIRGEWEDECSTITVEDVELLSKLGKLHLVKSTTLKGDELVGHWRKFPGKILRLSKMQLEAQDINMNTFLEYSKESLKELIVLKKRNGKIANVNWSLIPNLQKLSFLLAGNPRDIFPVEENITFSQLKELEIMCDPGKTPKSPRVPFPSVKILKLKLCSLSSSSQLMLDVCAMFSNVTCLDLCFMKNFSGVGHVIWKNMKQLMTLGVHIPDFGFAKEDADDEDEEYEFEDESFKFSVKLDACFTGYSKETCFELQEKFEGVAEISEDVLLQYDRENPSIVDLKYLTTLRLTYHVFQCSCAGLKYLREVQARTLQEIKQNISCVSRLFAFQQIPNLQLVIDTEVGSGC